jgi:uncharacterized protein (DUF302 family)
LRQLLLIFLLGVYSLASAQDLYMARTRLPFPEAMAVLQQSISDHGYTLSRVQRVDIGLTASGFQTDKYRVVFFGALDEVREITRQHPELVPYLPLKIAIFAEGDDTLLLASSFEHLRPFYESAQLRARFDSWEAGVRDILEDVRNAE